MKKLLLLSLIVMGLCTGCQKFISTSYHPAIFVIQKVTQDSQDKATNVAEYKVRMYMFSRDGYVAMGDNLWFTLEEGFQVGDTLRLTK